MSRRVHTSDLGDGWREHAACRGLDPSLFFAERPGQKARQAIDVCRRCPVRSDCLEWAIEAGETLGVLGGLTGDERDRIARHRGAA